MAIVSIKKKLGMFISCPLQIFDLSEFKVFLYGNWCEKLFGWRQ